MTDPLGYRLVAVEDLEDGMLVDLQGDKYADPEEDPEYEFEHALVEHAVRETDDCVRADFSGTSVGFPPDHRLRVLDEDPS